MKLLYNGWRVFIAEVKFLPFVVDISYLQRECQYVVNRW